MLWLRRRSAGVVVGGVERRRRRERKGGAERRERVREKKRVAQSARETEIVYHRYRTRTASQQLPPRSTKLNMNSLSLFSYVYLLLINRTYRATVRWYTYHRWYLVPRGRRWFRFPLRNLFFHTYDQSREGSCATPLDGYLHVVLMNPRIRGQLRAFRHRQSLVPRTCFREEGWGEGERGARV